MPPTAPLVSVLITAYNKRDYIEQTIQSILAQTLDSVEIVVTDDGSTDGTPDVIEKNFGKRVRLIRQQNAGPGAAFNAALAASRGKYIQPLDGDDLLLPHTLEQAICFLESSPDFDAVYGRIELFDSDTDDRQPHNTWFVQKPPTGPIWPEILLEGFILSHAAVLRRSAIERIGGWDASLPCRQDYDFWLRLGASGARFKFMDNTVGLYRQVTGSLSRNPVRGMKAHLRVLEKVPAYAGRLTGTARAYHRRHLCRIHTLLGREYLRAGRTALGCWHHLLAAWQRPAEAGRLFLECQHLVRKGTADAEDA